MLIRKLEKKDHPEIKEMLHVEHADNEYKYAIKSNAYVLENGEIIGIFGFKLEHGIPNLKTFCLKRKYRGFSNANLLIKSYINTIKELGFTKTFFTTTKEYFNKLLEWKFKIKPYATIGDINFYIMEVR